MERPDLVRCDCCGVPVDGPRIALRRCILCDGCDHLHGDKLQLRVVDLVSQGKLDPYHAITRMMVDDAHMTGRLQMVSPVALADGRVMVDVTVIGPVPRWLVAIARAAARNELPQINVVLVGVLARFFGLRATRAVLDEIRIDMIDALRFIEPSIIDIEVTSRSDAIDPEKLVIDIKASTPMLGTVVQMKGAPDVEIPADIHTRPRGQA